MTIMAELSAKVDITKSWSGRDWHSLQTGSPYFCFRIARGWVRGREPAMVWFEFCLLFRWTDLSLRVIAWLKENSTVAHSNRKTWTTQADISVKNPRIIAWKLNLEWEHLFRTFLTWFRRKNYLGGLETRTKEIIGPQCVLGVLCLVLFLSVGILFSNISI